MGVLEGRIAAVTGASSGSGRGITQRFLDEGSTVVMLARGEERLVKVAAELGPGAVPIVTDVGDPGSVAAAFDEIRERFGKLDILVNNAAVYRPCRVELLTDAEIEQQVATNFLGPVYTARAAIPLLRAAGGGDIVNTSSESTLHPFPMLSMYVCTGNTDSGCCINRPSSGRALGQVTGRRRAETIRAAVARRCGSVTKEGP